MNEEATFITKKLGVWGYILAKEYHCSKGIVHLWSLS